jgi:hypothetical protein
LHLQRLTKCAEFVEARVLYVVTLSQIGANSILKQLTQGFLLSPCGIKVEAGELEVELETLDRFAGDLEDATAELGVLEGVGDCRLQFGAHMRRQRANTLHQLNQLFGRAVR